MTRLVPRVEASTLQLGNDMGSGGQGKVTAIDSGGEEFDRTPVVLKRYLPAVADWLDISVLEDIVNFPLSLEPRYKAWLKESFAWPTRLVEDNGSVCGFLMRAVEPSFYFNFQTRTRGSVQQLASIGFLLNHDDYVSTAGLSISERDRLDLLKNLADILSQMHAFGLTIGDFSPKNILFKLSPSPSCLIIDCDAITLQGRSALPQIETPDWEIPAGESRATSASDSYKFGLLAVRLFARDQSSSDLSALAAISPTLGRLAERSQAPDPNRRPTPEMWIGALTDAAKIASTFRAPPRVPQAHSSETDASGPNPIGSAGLGWPIQHALGPAQPVRSSARAPVISL